MVATTASDRKKKIEAARKLRREGKRLQEIAEALGVSLATASLYCRNVLPGQAPDPRKAAGVALLRELYSQGTPISDIARQIGVPATTLYDWRREAGITRNSRRMYVTPALRERSRKQFSVDPDGSIRKEAVRLYCDELASTPEIAARFGVSSATVGQWLKQAGVPRRRRPTERVREKLRQANLGPKRPNWKGGISPETVRIRTSLDMKLAREACFKRDDYTCRSCGKRGGKLNAHHIWPFQRFRDLKFEIGNLLTLCKACHDSFHKAAGGHVKVAIGPFFHRPGTEVKEESATYVVTRPSGRLATRPRTRRRLREFRQGQVHPLMRVTRTENMYGHQD